MNNGAGHLKPIETVYRGYRFRSRLEARWAVFFDALGIDWEYESEGYELPSGRYLPDFWLPTFGGGMWAEVKPEGGDNGKASSLALQSGSPVWLCFGVPSARAYAVAVRLLVCAKFQGEAPCDEGRYCPGCPKGHTPVVRWRFCIPNFGPAEGTNGMWDEPDFLKDGMRIPAYLLDGTSALEQAVAAARSARFEFGQSGISSSSLPGR